MLTHTRISTFELKEKAEIMNSPPSVIKKYIKMLYNCSEMRLGDSFRKLKVKGKIYSKLR